MIITVETLRAALEAGERILVVDARNDSSDPSAPLRRWREGRIPGAVHLDMATVLSGPGRPDGIGGRNPMPTPAAFLAGLNAAGARQGMRIVACDERMEGVAARVWWIARELGIDVEVLEGGLAAWRAAGGAIETGDPVPAPAPGDRTCPADVDADVPVGSDGAGTVSAEQLAAPAPGLLLLDVRAESRYRGDVEPLDAVGGHIPGARNVPNVDADGQPTPQDLLDRLAAHDGEVVASCGSGVSACLMLLRLAQAGRSDAKLYPGSWSEWVALGLPYATGDEDVASG